MAEWLRRWTVNPLGSASVGTNPIFVVFFWFCGEMDSNMQFEFSKQSSNLGKKTVIFKTLAPTFFEIKKNNEDGIRTHASRSQWINSPSP